MARIMISASQIQEVLYKTTMSEGKARLSKYYNSFRRLEGVPIVEKIKGDTFRLITYYENHQFYKNFKPDILFECELKSFSTDEERYLALLGQLFHCKARTEKKDKYNIVNILKRTMLPEQISYRSGVDIKEINKLIFEDDKYKAYLEQGIKDRRGAITKDVVNYLKRYDIFKEETEDYILDLGKELTRKYFDVIKFVLIRIGAEFCWLTSDQQITLIKEMKDPGMKLLSNHFRKRCDELLQVSPRVDDCVQLNIQ